MKKGILLILVLILSACTTPETQVTVTLAPTEIPTQTPEPFSQAFIEVQQKFAETDIYTLTPTAIEMKQEDGTIKPIEGIKPNTKDGTFTITQEDEEFIVEFESINEKQITFKGEDERIWLWDGSKLFALPTEMTEKYLGQFETFEYGTKQVDEVDTNVIYGIKEDKTKKVVAMEVEINGQMRMTRVGETTVEDKNGNEHSFYVYLHPDHNIGGRVAVTDKTADILFESEPESKRDISFFISIGKQLGMTPEQVKDWVLSNDGIVNFKVAMGIPGSQADYPVTFKNLPYKADFNKPVEIIAIYSQAGYDALPQEIKDNLVYARKFFEDSGFISGNILWTKPNGQIQIITVETGTEATEWVLNPKPDEEKYVKEFLRKSTGNQILRCIDLPGRIHLGSDASRMTSQNKIALYDNIARNIFEYSVIGEE